MGLTFFDERTAARAEFVPAAPPAVGVALGGDSPRERAVHSSLTRALFYLGFQPTKGSELRVGGPDRGSSRVWLQVAPATGLQAPSDAEIKSRGFAPVDFHYLCLKTHYRKPLTFSWEALAAARGELADLRGIQRSLAAESSEPSPRGRAGYMIRFRDALARDLELPEALACLWDALRPGALSPGSRAALLKEIMPILGLS